MIQGFYNYLEQEGFFTDKSSPSTHNGRQILFFDQLGFMHQLFLMGDDTSGTLYYQFLNEHLFSISMTFPRVFILETLQKIITQTTTTIGNQKSKR
ncbi:MAG: hypothetical protein AAGI23_09475 [Bacteroidota bacterium]